MTQQFFANDSKKYRLTRDTLKKVEKSTKMSHFTIKSTKFHNLFESDEVEEFWEFSAVCCTDLAILGDKIQRPCYK